MTFENINYEVADSIATITINRPKVLNALNPETLREIESAVEKAGEDSAVRGVIITGAGEKAFVAGADINVLAKLTPYDGKYFPAYGQSVLNKIENLGKPVVAAVNGYALGGGCELALACHIRIASDNAVLGLPEVSLGIIPGYGGTQRLARLIGMGRALEMTLATQKIKADEALRIGLVNKVVPQSELMSAARGFLNETFANGPIAVRFALDAVVNGLEMPLKEGLSYEATLFGLICATEDMKEGLNAFIEKRKAQFKNK